MPVYPALDMIDGQCVRLQQGDFARRTSYANDPLTQAKKYRQAGARWLHLVDLDGARQGRPLLLTLIPELAELGLNIQTGGGIRRQEDIQALLDAGASRVVIGSQAVSQPEAVSRWLKYFGAERIVLALDVQRDSNGGAWLATHAWQHTSEKSLFDAAAFYASHGACHVLCTDISRDGQMQGAANAFYRQCVQAFPALRWQASGGIACLVDVQTVQSTGVDGVVIGKALLEGSLVLKEALACWPDA